MANITASLVKELRRRTGAGILECKKVLVKTHGDIELAIDNMRKSGQIKAAKKSSCVTREGRIFTKIDTDSRYGIILELNCETDFIANSDLLKTFGEEVTTFALNERTANLEDLRKNFEDKRSELILRTGENINIRRFNAIEDNQISHYLHNSRIGVIVASDKADANLMKCIAMHIAASRPEFIDSSSIPPSVIAREYQIQLDIIKKSGKSIKISDKIIKGRMHKFAQDISLTGQIFIMDASKTVGQLLNEYNVKINGFIRFELGEPVTSYTE